MVPRPVINRLNRKNPTGPNVNANQNVPFWRAKPLSELSLQEWESLCDGCGRCCLEKLEDFETGAISYTEVACPQLNPDTCRCANYAERHRYVPDCVPLSPANIQDLKWMPSTCAYRLLAEGKDLYDWHPLISGDPGTVAVAGISVRGRCVAAHDAGDLENHIVAWPE